MTPKELIEKAENTAFVHEWNYEIRIARSIDSAALSFLAIAKLLNEINERQKLATLRQQQDESLH